MSSMHLINLTFNTRIISYYDQSYKYNNGDNDHEL